ncbi:tRNA (guanine(26)-N(2))-dimethyltransferase [uncultured archaeon]|nr:tRNA (guanine(26)-N(2))-dimethyltransferase [uncultured archaeon]
MMSPAPALDERKDAADPSSPASPAGERWANPAMASEGLAKLHLHPDVFFNPHMRLCRDLSSLWVGTLPELRSVLDGFCASGARGLRYKLENKNVGHVAFVDALPSAVQLAEANAQLNGLGSGQYRVMRADINRLLGSGERFDLIEIDPFGTPVPYLAALSRCGNGLDERYISVTATDTAVLCGAHAQACYKGYAAKPVHSEICHESGLRILLGAIARAAAAEDWALDPQLCVSHRHYFKVLAKLTKGADGAVDTAKTAMTYITHCPHCLYHHMDGFPTPICAMCGERTQWGGPVWGGDWVSRAVVEKMMKLAGQRPYLSKEAVPLLSTIAAEADGPNLYYDLHELSSKHKRIIPSSEGVVEALQGMGYFASRTHFSTSAIRTDAPLGRILEQMQKR